MEVSSYQKGTLYSMKFKKGKPVGKLQVGEGPKGRSGTIVRWKSDTEVFTDIDIPLEYFTKTLMKQAVVNAGLTLNLKFEDSEGKFITESYYYENGILDYMANLIGETGLVPIQQYSCERVGRDRPYQSGLQREDERDRQ